MKPPPYRASPATMSNNNNNNNQHRNGEASSPSAAVNVEIFAAGDGIHYPKKGHTVTIHYAAFLGTENGELFDSVSYIMFCLLYFIDEDDAFKRLL